VGMKKSLHKFQEKMMSEMTFRQYFRDRCQFVLEHFELPETSDSSGTQSDSRVVARKNAYRKASAVLGLAGGGLALISSVYIYFLLEPFVSISAILMIAGSVLVWTRNTMTGSLLILAGGLFGGFFGLPSLLWILLATAFGDWAYSLPLLPLGMLLPVASFVLALMSREPSKAKLPL